MFVANSAYENSFLTALGASSGDRHYRAMEVHGRQTWFVVSCVAVQDDGFEMLMSFCCSLEEDLLGLLQPLRNARAVSVLRLLSSPDGDGRWLAQQVSKVWRAVGHRGRQVLLFLDADGQETTGPYGDPVDEEITERNLVFEASNVTAR